MISFNFLFLGCWLNYILGIFYVSFRQGLDLKMLKCSNFHSTVHVPKAWCIDIYNIYIYNHIQLLLRDWDQHALACFIGEQMMIQPNNTAVHSRAKRIKPSRHRSQVWTSLLWVGPPKAPNELATEWVVFFLIFFVFFGFLLDVFFTFSVWGSFPCYLLHFGAKISDLRAICCILEPKSLICVLFAAFLN